jgi:hypothetical protein
MQKRKLGKSDLEVSAIQRPRDWLTRFGRGTRGLLSPSGFTFGTKRRNHHHAAARRSASD